MRQFCGVVFDERVDLFFAGGGDAVEVFGEAAGFVVDVVAGVPEEVLRLPRASACRGRPGRASAWRVRGTCGGFPLVSSTSTVLCCEFALDGDHFDGGDGGFEALVACFEAGAVEGLFEGFAGEDAEGVGDAGLLLGLADAAGDFVVDGFVVGGFAAQEAAEGDDGVEVFGFGEGAGGGGDLPGAGDADDLDVGLGAPLRWRASSEPWRRRSVMTAFQRATTMAKRMPAAERSPSMAMGLLWSGFSDSQKPSLRSGASWTVKRREFQWVSSAWERRVAISSVRWWRQAIVDGAWMWSSWVTSMRMGGTAGARPVTNSRLPTGARKAAPRPWRPASLCRARSRGREEAGELVELGA